MIHKISFKLGVIDTKIKRELVFNIQRELTHLQYGDYLTLEYFDPVTTPREQTINLIYVRKSVSFLRGKEPTTTYYFYLPAPSNHQDKETAEKMRWPLKYVNSLEELLTQFCIDQDF